MAGAGFPYVFHVQALNFCTLSTFLPHQAEIASQRGFCWVITIWLFYVIFLWVSADFFSFSCYHFLLSLLVPFLPDSEAWPWQNSHTMGSGSSVLVPQRASSCLSSPMERVRNTPGIRPEHFPCGSGCITHADVAVGCVPLAELSSEQPRGRARAPRVLQPPMGCHRAPPAPNCTQGTAQRRRCDVTEP